MSESRDSIERRVRAELDFWRWFAERGLRSFWDRWLVVHLLIGIALAFLVRERLSEVAKVAFLPFASILVGLAFAWGGNAVAVLQTPEMQLVGSHPEDPTRYRSWVFSYQLAILVILVTLLVWALLAVGIANEHPLLFRHEAARVVGRTAAFALSSIAVRECWQVVLTTHRILLQRRMLQVALDKKDTR